MSVVASTGGSTTFLTFDSSQMSVNWYSDVNREAEIFDVTISASINILNGPV